MAKRAIIVLDCEAGDYVLDAACSAVFNAIGKNSDVKMTTTLVQKELVDSPKLVTTSAVLHAVKSLASRSATALEALGLSKAGELYDEWLRLAELGPDDFLDAKLANLTKNWEKFSELYYKMVSEADNVDTAARDLSDALDKLSTVKRWLTE